jgi:hypothetical protein
MEKVLEEVYEDSDIQPLSKTVMLQFWVLPLLKVTASSPFTVYYVSPPKISNGKHTRVY